MMLCYHNFAVAVLFARHARLASGKHVVLQLQVRRETAPDGGTVAGLRCCRNEGSPPFRNAIFFVLTSRLSVRFCRCGCRFNKRRTSSVAISCLVASCCLLKSTFTLLVMLKESIQLKLHCCYFSIFSAVQFESGILLGAASEPQSFSHNLLPASEWSFMGLERTVR